MKILGTIALAVFLMALLGTVHASMNTVVNVTSEVLYFKGWFALLWGSFLVSGLCFYAHVEVDGQPPE